jgi:release factor glutamine methyltransferase
MQKPAASRSPDWTILKLLEWTTAYFKSHAIESPRAAAELLLARVLKLKRVDLYVRYDQPLIAAELAQYKKLIKRRLDREPVAYILGTKEFWSLELAVTRDVLIPRPETECLVETALAQLTKNSGHGVRRVLDLGTGCGAVILALAAEQPQHMFFASDISLKAVELARQNARSHGLEEKIQFLCGHWLQPLRSRLVFFDIIVSNPPYIKQAALRGLQPEIYLYEPLAALDGGKSGLRYLKQIITAAHMHLKIGGSLLLEIGHDQREAVADFSADVGHYENITFIKDYSGYDRVVVLEKSTRNKSKDANSKK